MTERTLLPVLAADGSKIQASVRQAPEAAMPDYNQAMKTHTHTNIRKEPTRFSDVVQELLENERVEAAGLVDGDTHEGGTKWFPVKYNASGGYSVEGYIAEFLLTPV